MINDIQDGLQRFYAAKCEWGRTIRIANLMEISDGWENKVYSFTIERIGNRSSEDLILRVYPGDDAQSKAEDEYGGMLTLHELGFPVPEVLALELDESYFGKPFVTMEKVDGRPMGDELEESSEEGRQELFTLFCRMLVDLHALEWRHFVPDPSVYETGDPYVFVDQFLSMGQEAIHRHKADEFTQVIDWLRTRRLHVPCVRPSVVHMDYHPYNILLRRDGKALVIDWTSIGVSDSRMDLAWTLVLAGNYGNPGLRQIILDGYERLAEQRIEQVEYFEVVACVRRLFSIVVSIREGATKMGMRTEAVMSMKQDVEHIKSVYSLMRSRTGISIPEIETLVSTISSG